MARALKVTGTRSSDATSLSRPEGLSSTRSPLLTSRPLRACPVGLLPGPSLHLLHHLPVITSLLLSPPPRNNMPLMPRTSALACWHFIHRAHKNMVGWPHGSLGGCIQLGSEIGFGEAAFG